VTTQLTNPIDPALKGLPRGNVRAAGDFPAEEFELIRNVPVFAEHQTKARDGRELRFTQTELQQVADRCNRRISESGDYAALSLGHTPSPDDPNGKQPEIVGFAGPFRLGTVGQEGQRQRYAILADFHVFRDEVEKVRKHPRRSPEVWLEESYEEMFLDPIALLSSEAPRLDLGLLYAAQRQGRVVEKYTAVCPAAGNVFVPTDDYSANSHSNGGQTTMLTPEDIKQLMDAFEQTDIFQFVRSQMAEAQGPTPTVPPADPIPGAMPGAEQAAVPPAAPPAPPAGLAEPAGDMPPAGPALGPEGPPAPDAAGPPDAPAGPEPPMAPAGDEDPEKMSRYSADGKANTTGEYQTADEKEDMGGSKIDHDPIGSPKKYAALDELEEDEIEDYLRKRRKSFQGKRRKNYAAEEGSADGKNSEKPTEGDVDPANPGPKGEGSADDVEGEATGEYQKATPPAKFSRQLAEDRAELEQLRSDQAGLREQLNAERASRVDAERYSALAERRQCYAFDLDQEVERCCYKKMSPEQFDDHLAVIEGNYRQIPLGAYLPTQGAGAKAPPSQNGERLSSGIAREKYDKQTSERALAICERQAMEGQQPVYEEVLAKLQAGEDV